MSEKSPVADASIDAARDAAITLAQNGRVNEAEQSFRALLERAPNDADALNFLAICAHGRGSSHAALQLLERARVAHPADATTLTNLGAIHREAGRFDEAESALRDAVRAGGGAVARLRLAEAVAACGRTAEALPLYFGAVTAAQKQGQWLSEATTPSGLRTLVLQAMRAIHSGRRQLYSDLLAPLRATHGASEMRRVEHCLQIYLEERPADFPEAAQRPKFLYFPDLPAPRYFPRDLFPWYEPLEAQTDAIRAEMLAALHGDGDFEPFLGHVDNERTLQAFLRGERGTPAWNALFFFRHGERNEETARRCPNTSAALDAVPLCRVRAHAPEVCYSVLTPGSHILPHHGVTNTRVVTHLPLVVPADCALVVGGESRAWEEGVCFSFDDTFEHEAWNRSADTRVVMLLDAWNPYLTEIERVALTELIAAIGDFSQAAEAR